MMIERMRGLTFREITGMHKHSDRVSFVSTEGRRFDFFHSPECCESVQVEDVAGDVRDLLDAPLVMAEVERCGDQDPPERVQAFNLKMEQLFPGEQPYKDDAWAWTFYKFGTVKGYVTVRWLGSSNGWYGVDVECEEIEARG